MRAPDEAFAGLRNARAKGGVVVRSTRVASGFATQNAEVNDDVGGFVAAEEVKPSKARLVLQIRPAEDGVPGRDPEGLRQVVGRPVS
jgi:L-asparaginase/Glu-tRNA(Gln) amidotransferase subunit D